MPRLWMLKIIGPALLLVGAVVGFRAYIASQRADERKDVTQEFTVAQKEADIADLRKTLTEERKRNSVTEKKNEELSRDMAADRAGLGAYIERLRRTLASGAKAPGVTEVASAPGEPVAAGGVPLMDDLRACTENTRRLINARDWYADQRALKPEVFEVKK